LAPSLPPHWVHVEEHIENLRDIMGTQRELGVWNLVRT
jgi:hypothetical protein